MKLEGALKSKNIILIDETSTLIKNCWGMSLDDALATAGKESDEQNKKREEEWMNSERRDD